MYNVTRVSGTEFQFFSFEEEYPAVYEIDVHVTDAPCTPFNISGDTDEMPGKL